MLDALAVAVRREVVFAIVFLFHKEDVGVPGGGHICKQGMSTSDSTGDVHEPETPSPKKKRSGGDASSLYGNIARDLSCPKPLRVQLNFEVKTPQKHARIPSRVAELDVPFTVWVDIDIVRDDVDGTCDLVADEIRQHGADTRRHSTADGMRSAKLIKNNRGLPRNNDDRNIIRPTPRIEVFESRVELDVWIEFKIAREPPK